jgi:predicted RNase H-like HicB family nuclease
MSKINLKSVVWKEGKFYVSQCLGVDISSFGKTRKEAVDSLKEALELHFENSSLDDVSKVERPILVPITFSHA